jgi:predicted alpha/beta hydrolase
LCAADLCALPHGSRMSEDTMTRSIEIETGDGFRIAARVYEPMIARANVLIHGATATPQRYYTSFANELASRGYRVITYDYRGIGESRPRSLRKLNATMTDWAEQDTRAAYDLALSFEEPLVIIGHSFGGQSLGLIDTPPEVRGAVLVGAQFGYAGHWPAPRSIVHRALWSTVMPAAVGAFGYLPGFTALGVDLPAGVAREWGKWCSSPGYLLDYVPEAADRFASFDRPTLFYSFTDDAFAPRPAVNAFLEAVPAHVVHRRFAPGELRRREIGHFGFFRRNTVPSLWEETIQFIDQVARGTRPTIRSHATWEVGLEEIEEDLAYGRA